MEHILEGSKLMQRLLVNLGDFPLVHEVWIGVI